jgi:hypothetical protein
MTDFGAGPLLTQDFDFEVTTTGDLDITRESDELQKDLALFLSISLGEYIGDPAYQNTGAKISSQVDRTLNNDPRINNVIDVEVTFFDSGNKAEVVATATTDNGEQELVFTIYDGI